MYIYSYLPSTNIICYIHKIITDKKQKLSEIQNEFKRAKLVDKKL